MADLDGYALTLARIEKRTKRFCGQQAIQRGLPGRQGDPRAGRYARGSRVSTSEPIHRTLHGHRATVHYVQGGL